MMTFLDPAHLPCGYIVVGLDGELIEANPAFLEMIGVAGALKSPSHFVQFLSVASQILYKAQLSTALQLRASVEEFALDLLHTSGRRVPVLVNARTVQCAPAGTRQIHMALLGASERRRYENEIMQARDRAERLAEVIHRSSDAILIVSPEGVLESWNQGAERIFGHLAERAVGASLVDLLFPAEIQAHASRSIGELNTGKAIAFETVALHQQGHEIAVSIHLNPHIDPPGLLTSFSAIIRDITSRKLSERALMQNDKLASVGRLASSIAHEINNPLESVTNLLYILNLQTEDTAMKNTIQTAQVELAHASQIATHTLRFHKQSTGQTRVSLDALIQSLLSLFRLKLQDSKVVLKAQRLNASPLLCYDGELRQVLTNLIGNALDAMRTGGTLILRCRDTSVGQSEVRRTRITIADTGGGIGAGILPHIFEPFFTTKGIAGTGLGLWITHELVAKNRGTIQVRSRTQPGRSGTVFVLQFPNEQPR